MEWHMLHGDPDRLLNIDFGTRWNHSGCGP
jgi:hypothetical protein